MPECVHWYELAAPVGDRVPGKCRDCGAEKDWPARGVQAEGRPWILRDPLLARVTGSFGLPAYY